MAVVVYSMSEELICSMEKPWIAKIQDNFTQAVDMEINITLFYKVDLIVRFSYHCLNRWTYVRVQSTASR